MHQSLVYIRKWQDDVLEGILGLSFDSQNCAQAIDVMSPEQLVLASFDRVEDWLYSDKDLTLLPHALCDSWSAFRSSSGCRHCERTLFGPFSATLPNLLFMVSLTDNSIFFAVHACTQLISQYRCMIL